MSRGILGLMSLNVQQIVVNVPLGFQMDKE